MLGSQSIDGISSGLDTTAIVDAIIQFERRNAVVLEAQQLGKTNTINAIKAIQARLLALNVNVNLLRRNDTFEKAKITVSDETVLQATTIGRVTSGSFDVEVMDLARNHQIASQGFDDATDAIFGTGSISITVGTEATQTVTIDAGNNTLTGLKKALNDANLGVTASIINDGSSTNPFRLLLSSNKSGVANDITISSSLSGGKSPNFATASFDTPEKLKTGSTSTSAISLGSTASFTGSANKIYTFTVAGTGSQTVGTDNITINFTDGTNTGSIIITQADTEVALVGTGSDGLKLSFATGTLTAGDTFQVQTFAPTLQEATDAKIGFGSNGGAGSPIIVTSETNEFKDIVVGVKLTVQKVTTPGTVVNVTTDLDIAAIKKTFNKFIASYNDVMDFIDKQNTFDSDSELGGILLGDLTVQRTQNQIRRTLGSSVTGIDTTFKQLFAVGLRTTAQGRLAIKDNSRFEKALRDNIADVIKMFGDSGTSNSSLVEYVSQTAETKIGENYKVDISNVATQGRLQAGEIDDPANVPMVISSSNNKLKFRIGSLESEEIALTAKTYKTGNELATELQKQIDADKKIGPRGVTVTWVPTITTPGAEKGYLQFVTDDFGSSATITNLTSIGNSAFSITGLAIAQVFAGENVDGTINGEQATGIGQTLTGNDGNRTTDGLKLKITLDNTQLKGDEEATVSVIKGIAAKLHNLIESVTASGGGLLDSRIRGEQKQVENLQERIEQIDKNLVRRRDRLMTQFLAMEAALGQFSTQSAFLGQQLANIQANFRPNSLGR